MLFLICSAIAIARARKPVENLTLHHQDILDRILIAQVIFEDSWVLSDRLIL